MDPAIANETQGHCPSGAQLGPGDAQPREALGYRSDREIAAERSALQAQLDQPALGAKPRH